jgi:exonuclease III
MRLPSFLLLVPFVSTLRIVQYNTEWLFTEYYAAANCPGSGCTWANSTEASIHLSYVAANIQKLAPDILHLCEVESINELNQIIIQTTNPITLTPYLVKGTDTTTGQNVGLITSQPLLVQPYRVDDRVDYPLPGSNCSKSYTGEPGSTGVSKHIVTEFAFTDTINVAFIGAHLLAYPDDIARCVQREGQAMVLHNLILEYIKKDYEIVVLGDFNDFDDEVLDKNNNHPISEVLTILKGEPDYSLYNVAEEVVKTERYSDWWDKNGDCIAESTEFSAIDFVLVSPGLKPFISNVFFYHGYSEFCGKYDSDHFPLVVDLMII